ncbi:MAG: mandelate racemase [Paenibacillus sp.]|jgi:L-alanine-DL-glutamate epimerase-like enolase superfamily enzyme|nr:mandelate racemase [Paenibacillus sp.]
MKIVKIEPMGLRYVEPNDDFSTRHTMLVRVETDSGLVGWGEGIVMWPEAVKSAAALIEGGLGELLLGQDPLDIEKHWQAMKEHVWWYGGDGGIASFAISALDMALWDLKGKALGLPLYKLFGGKVWEKIPANASIHIKYFEHEKNASEIKGYIDEGYQSVKVGFGKRGTAKLGLTEAYDMEFVKQVRKAIGPDVGFMIDVGHKVKWDVAHAIRMVHRFAEYGIDWIEEPFEPNQLADFARLKQATGCLLATGERESTVDAYSRLIRSGVVDIVGIDPARSDGITGFLKVLTLVADAKIKFNTHAWSTALTTAASIHLSLFSPHCIIMELKPLANPMQDELVKNPIRQRDGWVYPLEEPGLGVEIDEESVRKHRFC